MRWKEVERIESQEIILPIVKAKRNRLDSLKRERLRKQQLRVIAQHSNRKQGDKKLPVNKQQDFIAIKPNDEEQFV
jgi:hypothetical protein